MDYAKMWKEALERHRPVFESEWFKQKMRDFVWEHNK